MNMMIFSIFNQPMIDYIIVTGMDVDGVIMPMKTNSIMLQMNETKNFRRYLLIGFII